MRVLGDVAAHRRRADRGAQGRAVGLPQAPPRAEARSRTAEDASQAQGDCSPRAWTRWCAPRRRSSTFRWRRSWSWAVGFPRACWPRQGGGPWGWALGRLGARAPLYGSVHRAVPAQLATEWLDLLLARGLNQVDGAPFAVAQLARRTQDRARDVDEETRARAVSALVAAKAPDSFVRMVTDVKELEATDEARALGDTLPVGLRLG